VSLQEQQSAISACASRQNLQIVEWYEERETAAKVGRPVFRKMLQALKAGRADGVIIHKIDRSSRNWHDWGDIGELVELGIAVYFAHEKIDMNSRSGRLTADVLAVVAADYIRNLREEARKGLYGRLKQGIYPWGAPLGYLNKGGGRPKEIDPERGPLIRRAFELYAAGGHTLKSLSALLFSQGLRNHRGRPVTVSNFSEILNNPFYVGLMYVRTTGETYQGKHTPLVSMPLFNRVRDRLAGKTKVSAWLHDYLFRGLFKCLLCGCMLVGETQKGHIYYRCHTRDCPTKSFREEVLEAALLMSWPPIAATDEWKAQLLTHLDSVDADDRSSDDERRAGIQLHLSAVASRLERLTDALVDGLIDRQVFNERRAALLQEQRLLEESLESRTDSSEVVRLAKERLELASVAQWSYRLASRPARRELVILMSSNRSVAGKNVSVEPRFPRGLLEDRAAIAECGHQRNSPRTLRAAAKTLLEWAKTEFENGPPKMPKYPYRKAA
jgi:DNA invertase Pin-like site-specific DNA recombinase